MKHHGCMGIHTDGMSAHETSNDGTSGYDPRTGDMFAQGTRVFAESCASKHPCKELRGVLRVSRGVGIFPALPCDALLLRLGQSLGDDIELRSFNACAP